MTTTIDYDDGSNKIAAEQELRKFSDVVEGYASSLQQQLRKVQQHCIVGNSSLHVLQPHQIEPVKIKLSPYEPDGVYHTRSDIDAVNKVVLVLTALCQEVKLLLTEANNELIPPIVLYGETLSAQDISESSGASQLSISLLLHTLSRTDAYVTRVAAVSGNVLQQLGVLHSQATPVSMKDVHLQVVWEQLGRLLGSLVALDEAVAANSLLHQHWGAYKRLVRNAPTVLGDAVEAVDGEALKLDKEALRPLLTMLDDIQKNVLQGNMLKRVCGVCGGIAAVVNNATLRDEMLTVMLGWCTQLDAQCSEPWWSDLQPDVVAVTCLYLLHQHVYDPPHSKRMVKALTQLFRKVPCITLYGALVWHGECFIASSSDRLAASWDARVQDAARNHRHQHLTAVVVGLARQAQTTDVQIGAWGVEMSAAATKPASEFSRQDLSQRTALFLQGVVLAISVQYTVISTLNLHASLGRPLPRACALSVCALLRCLHRVHLIYNTHAMRLLPHALPLIMQYIVAQLMAAVAQAKQKVGDGGERNAASMDVLGCLAVVEHCLGGAAPTTLNTNTVRVALSITNQRGTFKDDELSKLVLLLRRLELVCDLQARVTAATDVGPLLYLHRVLPDTCLDGVMAGVGGVAPDLIQPVLWCASHSRAALMRVCHLDEPQLLYETFREALCTALQEKVINPVCSIVETELRLSSHTQLQLLTPTTEQAQVGTTGTAPPKRVCDPLPFLILQPINCLGKIIHIKACVEQHLSRTFYALTVVAPHDCHTYQEMRTLAQHKWGLQTQSARLPAHTTHQGVDVLEVVRQLSVFVRCYHYSLSQQVFVEAESSSKHLNTLGISHIANSIRTHGPGVINSTVNFTYQFLASKFKVFSQFLYDEQIKSRLIQDKRHWKEVRTPEEKWFPFERAEKFNLAIRKLGVNAQGLSYLDQFRGLVTQIGNAMGYVRLVKSGALRCSSNTIRFLPDLARLRPFMDLCQPDGDGVGEKMCVSEQTLAAARNLDQVILNLRQTFHKDTDYFKILVEVFRGPLSEHTNAHLRNFYLIVPALALNFVHCAITAKDRLKKKSKTGAAFTMDGFAMGVAYLLNVLNQGTTFDSLHWWSGVRRYFITQTEKVEKQRSDCVQSGDQKLSETLSLTLTRLQQHQQEHELLYLTLASARAFFGSRGHDDEAKGDKDSVKSGDKDSVKSGDSEGNKTGM